MGENAKLPLEYFGEGGVEGNKWLQASESEIQPCTVIKICFYGELSVWDLVLNPILSFRVKE